MEPVIIMNAVTYIQIALGNFNVIHRPKLLPPVSDDDDYKLLYNIMPVEKNYIINNEIISINCKIYLKHFIYLDYLDKNGSKILRTPEIMADYMSVKILINKSKQLN